MVIQTMKSFHDDAKSECQRLAQEMKIRKADQAALMVPSGFGLSWQIVQQISRFEFVAPRCKGLLRQGDNA